MKLLVFSLFAVAAFAAPQGYTQAEPSGPQILINREQSPEDDGVAPQNIGTSIRDTLTIREDSDAVPDHSTRKFSTGTDSSIEDIVIECPEGEVRHADGSCVAPEISRNIFLFSVPKQQQLRSESLPDIPLPKVEHNILFVRLAEGGAGPDPIVVPPPRQENVIYVLRKQNDAEQRVIEVPAPPTSEPEIYFVNYAEGENPTLPGGVDLQSALGSAATTSGQFIGGTGFSSRGSVDEDSSNEVSDSGVLLVDGSSTTMASGHIGASSVENLATIGVAEDDQDIDLSVNPSVFYQAP